mmetsp:Transcript_23762/g.59967  ORF Transcript_23762/g.59967 Transcript_23762/m.59967 type:complete len:225 (+) Transcript_23762:3850-4524(+)
MFTAWVLTFSALSLSFLRLSISAFLSFSSTEVSLDVETGEDSWAGERGEGRVGFRFRCSTFSFAESKTPRAFHCWKVSTSTESSFTSFSRLLMYESACSSVWSSFSTACTCSISFSSPIQARRCSLESRQWAIVGCAAAMTASKQLCRILHLFSINCSSHRTSPSPLNSASLCARFMDRAASFTAVSMLRVASNSAFRRVFSTTTFSYSPLLVYICKLYALLGV